MLMQLSAQAVFEADDVFLDTTVDASEGTYVEGIVEDTIDQ